MNNGQHQPGAEGSSNFTIRGGVLDQKDTARGAIIFGCADGVLMENVILKDVKNNQYYYTAVLWAVENGITSGTSATTFEPDGCGYCLPVHRQGCYLHRSCCV